MILKTVFKAQAPCGIHHSDAVKAFSFFDFMDVEPVGSAFFFAIRHPRECKDLTEIFKN